ncbi:ABC transporter ATP-binding protein [Ancylobacter amanitiformis]|uniref:NitT/TauT family transport system ATP-binding protein n=1 Tax=Ancylobacter amanitiformis TaxID=217069 RepID=A0ABU0LN39_9HYPH|nr:ATP-binding cassette domain-containing protein [Ancylobacter amanitiformis]MDQ0510078.1 NitT/TauT family transport system ATP-binding protein [Ancylobacter amanitiformis]
MSAIGIHIMGKQFPARAGAPAREIFRDFRLDVAAGEFLVLLGASGLGKTTLLNIIAGLDAEYRGAIRFAGAPPRIAYAFQSPRLLPWRTVLENVALVLPSGTEGQEAARAMLADVGLAELADAYPERLSLGQQRRVALARAFVMRPDLLLMDEPFVSLDTASARRLRDLLRRLIIQHPATVLFVTHDSREAAALASRIVRLEGTPVHIARDVRVELGVTERGSPARLQAFLSDAGLAEPEALSGGA